MKTLIILGATNVLLGFTSFVLSKHVVSSTASLSLQAKRCEKRIARYPIENNHIEITPRKKPVTPVKIKKKAFVTRVKINPPVIKQALPDSDYNRHVAPDSIALVKETGLDDYNYMQLMDKAEKLQEYAKENGYSTAYGLLVNMGMKSGKKRFFVVDLSSMVIIERGIMAGSCGTLLGMYKIGCADASYRVFGLQPRTSSYCKKGMALRTLNTIPENEVEHPVFQSEGCPAICPAFFNEVSSIIDKSEKPVLMWIFDTEKESELVNAY